MWRSRCVVRILAAAAVLILMLSVQGCREPRDPAEAYQEMLTHARETAKQYGIDLKEAIDATKEKNLADIDMKYEGMAPPKDETERENRENARQQERAAVIDRAVSDRYLADESAKQLAADLIAYAKEFFKKHEKDWSQGTNEQRAELKKGWQSQAKSMVEDRASAFDGAIELLRSVLRAFGLYTGFTLDSLATRAITMGANAAARSLMAGGHYEMRADGSVRWLLGRPCLVLSGSLDLSAIGEAGIVCFIELGDPRQQEDGAVVWEATRLHGWMSALDFGAVGTMPTQFSDSPLLRTQVRTTRDSIGVTLVATEENAFLVPGTVLVQIELTGIAEGSSNGDGLPAQFHVSAQGDADSLFPNQLPPILNQEPVNPTAPEPVKTPPPCSCGGSGLDCKKAYVVNHEGCTVSVVDLGTGKVTTTTPVGSGPYAIAISGNKAYVANYLDSTVSVIDTTTGAVTKTIAVGWGPLAIATSGNKVYVANYYQDNTVSVIDTTTDEVTKTIAVGGGPSNIEIDGNKAYALNHLDGTVSVIDITTDEVTQTITTESDPEDIAIFYGSKAYVSNGLSNTVSVINLLTQTVTATVPVGKNACAIAICGSKVYVANYDDGTISVIDILTNAVTPTIPVGNNPSSIAICGNKAYVTNSGDGTVSVIDTATDTVTATFPAGNSPKTIVFGP